MEKAHPATTLFPLVLAGLLAGMSYWLELASRPTHPDNNGKQRHDPDYIVQNFEVRRFNDEGVLQSTLFADEMRHYPDDDTTTVVLPRLTFHRDPPTFVRSREGQIDSTGEHVELIDNVYVKREGKFGKPPTELTTARLHAYPDDEIAISHVPVTIVQGLSNITGNTMNANNKSGTYVLDGAVHGIFHRNGGVAPVSGTMSPVASSPPQAARPVVTPAAKPAAVAKPKPKSKPKAKVPSRPKTKSKPKTKH